MRLTIDLKILVGQDPEGRWGVALKVNGIVLPLPGAVEGKAGAVAKARNVARVFGPDAAEAVVFQRRPVCRSRLSGRCRKPKVPPQMRAADGFRVQTQGE